MLFLEQVIGFLILLTIAIITSSVAWSLGFFHLPNQEKKKKVLVGWQQVAGGFVILISVEILAIPLFYIIWIFFKEGKIHDLASLKLNVVQQGWLHILAILATGLALLIYCLALGKQVMKDVWGKGINQQKGEIFFNFLMGILAWLIVYPLIGALGQFIDLLFSLFYLGPHVDQIAVKHLKSLMNKPQLFYIMVIEIVTIVPIIEELIFRGFLQTWLKEKLGIIKAILITSAIFAIFHFSFGQGIDNIELIVSLFVLSCFLGFLRERQQSLWASIGLHATFNAMSIFFLLKSI